MKWSLQLLPRARRELIFAQSRRESRTKLYIYNANASKDSIWMMCDVFYPQSVYYWYNKCVDSHRLTKNVIFSNDLKISKLTTSKFFREEKKLFISITWFFVSFRDINLANVVFLLLCLLSNSRDNGKS